LKCWKRDEQHALPSFSLEKQNSEWRSGGWEEKGRIHTGGEGGVEDEGVEDEGVEEGVEDRQQLSRERLLDKIPRRMWAANGIGIEGSELQEFSRCLFLSAVSHQISLSLLPLNWPDTLIPLKASTVPTSIW
jgi:hypothetical protein